MASVDDRSTSCYLCDLDLNGVAGVFLGMPPGLKIMYRLKRRIDCSICGASLCEGHKKELGKRPMRGYGRLKCPSCGDSGLALAVFLPGATDEVVELMRLVDQAVRDIRDGSTTADTLRIVPLARRNSVAYVNAIIGFEHDTQGGRLELAYNYAPMALGLLASLGVTEVAEMDEAERFLVDAADCGYVPSGSGDLNQMRFLDAIGALGAFEQLLKRGTVIPFLIRYAKDPSNFDHRRARAICVLGCLGHDDRVIDALIELLDDGQGRSAQARLIQQWAAMALLETGRREAIAALAAGEPGIKWDRRSPCRPEHLPVVPLYEVPDAGVF